MRRHISPELCLALTEWQEHEKAKNGLKNAIIGFVLIFILLIMLQVGLPILSEWLAANEGM